MGSALLLAGLLLGQTTDADAPDLRSGRYFTQTWRSSGGWTTSGWTDSRSADSRPPGRFLDRVGNLFGLRRESEQPRRRMDRRSDNVDEIPAAPRPVEPAPVSAAPSEPPPEVGPRRLPTRIALSPEITIEAVDPDAAPAPVKPAAFDPKPRRAPSVDARFVPRLARAADYAWVTGQLHVSGDSYQLHFTQAGPDAFGGIFTLRMTGDLSALQDGDLITVHGRIEESRGATPVYRPLVVHILERK
ncbi:MAG: hypothetical protein U0793_23365 [Gemmataceae bacterium]